MTLVVVVLSLVLERFLGHWQHIRKLPWFSRYRIRLFALLPEHWQDSYIGGSILLALPVLLVMLIHYALAGYAWGLWQILFGVLVLTYCFGPEAFNERVDAYLQAHEEHDRLKAMEIAESLVCGPVSDNTRQQAQAVATSILYEGNVRIFALIFWFILLGPAGALLYRSANYLARDVSSWGPAHLVTASGQFYALLDWVPARLLSLTFFLTGSFDDALQAWRQVNRAEQDLAESNRSIVINTGCGAMQHEVDETLAESVENEQEARYDLYWVRTARALVIRSLVVWLTVVALFTMAGWFV